MTYARKPAQSAAEILRSMENLVMLEQYDIVDAREGLQEAMDAFNAAPCETIADALAFISASRRPGQSIIIDILHDGQIDQYNVEAADRYMETAIAFFRGEEMRREYGHFAGFTRH